MNNLIFKFIYSKLDLCNFFILIFFFLYNQTQIIYRKNWTSNQKIIIVVILFKLNSTPFHVHIFREQRAYKLHANIFQQFSHKLCSHSLNVIHWIVLGSISTKNNNLIVKRISWNTWTDAKERGTILAEQKWRF